MYATSTVAVQQLEAVGFKVDHQVTDWATVIEKTLKITNDPTNSAIAAKASRAMVRN